MKNLKILFNNMQTSNNKITAYKKLVNKIKY